MKKVVNKWQWTLGFARAYEYLPKQGMYRFRIGVFQFKTLPPSGVYPSKKNIGKGFLWQFRIQALRINKEI